MNRCIAKKKKKRYSYFIKYVQRIMWPITHPCLVSKPSKLCTGKARKQHKKVYFEEILSVFVAKTLMENK